MTTKKPDEENKDVFINRLIHEPVRLKILAYLSMVESADFVFINSRLNLTTGNLSSHVTKLKNAGYIIVQKEFKDNRPHTILSISEKGNKEFEKYRDDILKILD